MKLKYLLLVVLVVSIQMSVLIVVVQSICQSCVSDLGFDPVPVGHRLQKVESRGGTSPCKHEPAERRYVVVIVY